MCELKGGNFAGCEWQQILYGSGQCFPGGLEIKNLISFYLYIGTWKTHKLETRSVGLHPSPV